MAIGVHDPLLDGAGSGDPGGGPFWDGFGERPEERWARGTLDELADGIRQLEAAMAGLRREQLAALAELARRCGHVVDGCATPVDWLMVATTCSRPTARQHVDVAVALGGLPAVADAFGSGVLSFDQVARLVRFVTPDTDRAWADGAVGRSVHELEALARSLRPPSRAQLADARARRCLRLRDDDQETRITGRVPVAEGALLRAFLEPLAADVAADTVADTLDHWGARLADALCQRAAQQPPEGARARRATIVVHATPDQLTGEADTPATLAETLTPLARQVLSGLRCDGDLEVHVDDPLTGRPIGIGRASRNVPAWLARAVLDRDHTCRVPGCDRPAVHLHHVEFSEHGGPTDKANLAGLCWHHHQRIHLDGFTLTGNADHHLEWRDQRGRLIGTTRPALHQRLSGRPPPTT